MSTLKLAVLDLRIDLGDAQVEVAAVVFGDGDLPEVDAAEVVLVDVGTELVTVRVVDLAQPPAGVDRLADLDGEAGQLAGDRRAGC